MRALAAAAVLTLAAPAGAAPFRLSDAVVPLAEAVSLELDPTKDDYHGSVSIELEVRRPAGEVRLHLLGPRVTRLRLARAGRAFEATHAPGEHDTLVVQPVAPLPPGRYTLDLDFQAAYGRQGVGLYKVEAGGESYLYTQFEAIEARRAFPCFDEPSFKIPWRVKLTVPAGYEAVTNAPVARADERGGARAVSFATTPPLPAYLVALAVGRFDAVPIVGLKVPGRVLTPRGSGARAAFVAESTPAILAALQRFAGMRYPYAKLDLIAAPEFWYGAMENPGAIVFRDLLILVEPGTPPRLRDVILEVLAHELAHMWFGDLVTMAWWDDFWLNESFADWLSRKVMREVHPALGEEIDAVRAAQTGMNRDARPSTIALAQPDIAPDEAMRNVGNTYDKGTGVLQMFEGVAGPDRFRDGLRDYFVSRAWSNATTAEFFETVSRHAPAGTDAAMRGFVVQPGVPLVTVERAGPTQLRLTQERFSTLPGAAPLSWSIPVRLRLGDGTESRTLEVLLDGPERRVDLPGPAAWILPQADASGYYRWRLPDEDLLAVARVARAALSPSERLAVLLDAGALFVQGSLHAGPYLQVLELFVDEPEPKVALQVVESFDDLYRTFATPKNRARLARYLGRRLRPMLKRIGTSARADEPAAVGELRASLLEALVRRAGDPAARRLAVALGRRALAGDATVDPALAGVSLRAYARDGGVAAFDELTRRIDATESPIERRNLLVALAVMRRPEARDRVFDYFLHGKLKPSEVFAVLEHAEDEATADEVFSFFTTHFDALARMVPRAFQAFFAEVGAGCSRERLGATRRFFAERDSAEGTRKALDRLGERVEECAALKDREQARVEARLAR